MTILLISDFLPSLHADSAGVLDAAYLLKDLSKEHKIILICNYSKNDKEHFEEVKAICHTAYFIRNRTFDNRIIYLLKTLFSYLSRYPAIVRMTLSNRFKSRLKEIIKKEAIDLVLFEFTQSMIYIDQLEGKYKTVVDESDIAFIRRERFINNNYSGIIRKILLYDNYKLRKYEIDYLNKIDKVMVRTEKDKEILKQYGIRHTKDEMHVFLPWVNFSGAERTFDPAENEKNIMFYGAMWRPVNREAVIYFVQNIFGQILEKHPDAKFYIVGSKPGKKIESIASENVIVTGFVDSIEDYYYRSRVIVVPLLSGSGIKGKVIQALGFGVPVVTTSIGAEGINEQYDTHFIIKDDPTSFAAAVSALLDIKTDCKNTFKIKDQIQSKYNWNDNYRKTHLFIST